MPDLELDIGPALELLRRLSPALRMKAWAEVVAELARRNARNRVVGRFGLEVAEKVEFDIHGDTADVYVDNPIAVHVHFGGPIRSRNGRRLAIPLDNATSRRENPRRLFARDLGMTTPLLRRGDLLFRAPEKGRRLGAPLFVLRTQTRPQRPRPWWPTPQEAMDETERFIAEDL